MNLLNKATISINKGLIKRNLDDEAIIVMPENAMITSLNKSGTFVLELIQQKNQTFDDLLNSMLEVYDVNIEVARKDLIDFLEELLTNKLIILE